MDFKCVVNPVSMYSCTFDFKNLIFALGPDVKSVEVI